MPYLPTLPDYPTVAPPENRQRLLKLMKLRIVVSNRQRRPTRESPEITETPFPNGDAERLIGRPTRESPEITETQVVFEHVLIGQMSPHQRIARDY